MSRRSFLEAAIAALGVAGLTSCLPPSVTNATFSPLTVTLADFPALAAVGGVAVVRNGSGGTVPVAVVRTGETSYLALSMVCPHQGITVSKTGSGFYCPGHGATFGVDGAHLSGPSPSGLHQYGAVFNATSGTLQIG